MHNVNRAGATNMATGAALATINRLPVLLLPGDIFAKRTVAPVLQQLELAGSQDVSVNDCLQTDFPLLGPHQSTEQLLTSLPEAMRVLTSPAETGAVTLCLPQDVQAEAFDFPEEWFRKRTWFVPRPPADRRLLATATEWIRKAKRPLIIAGGGVIYSDASAALAEFVSKTGIPVAETQAGKGSLAYDHAQQLGAVGVTGTPGANITAREADLVIGIGTRYSDFTTASKTAFQCPAVRFININIAEFDSHKQSALPLTSDARTCLEDLTVALADFRVSADYSARITEHRKKWEAEVDRIYGIRIGPPIQSGRSHRHRQPGLGGEGRRGLRRRQFAGRPSQTLAHTRSQGLSHGIRFLLHGLRNCRRHRGQNGGPKREVFVMVGDGSYLMMAQEIVTAVQEGYKLNIVLLDNHGFSSIGGLSRACGNRGMGTDYRYRQGDSYTGGILPVDFAANAASLGAHAVRVKTGSQLRTALVDARKRSETTVVVCETAIAERVPGYESWGMSQSQRSPNLLPCGRLARNTRKPGKTRKFSRSALDQSQNPPTPLDRRLCDSLPFYDFYVAIHRQVREPVYS